MADAPNTPLLDTVKYPADLRKLRPDQLRQLADELRSETISARHCPFPWMGHPN